MKNLILVILIISSSVLSNTSNKYKIPDEHLKIILQIGAMAGKDQAIRYALLNAESHGLTMDEIARDTSIIKLMDKIDQDNTEALKKIVKKYGWPGIKKFGEYTDNNAFLIVQHAIFDSSFQEEILKILDKARKDHDSLPSHYAYLYDRIYSHKNLKQRYATQGRCINHHWQPFPIENPAELDKRRHEVGLEPYTEYLKQVSKICP